MLMMDMENGLTMKNLDKLLIYLRDQWWFSAIITLAKYGVTMEDLDRSGIVYRVVDEDRVRIRLR